MNKIRSAMRSRHSNALRRTLKARKGTTKGMRMMAYGLLLERRSGK